MTTPPSNPFSTPEEDPDKKSNNAENYSWQPEPEGGEEAGQPRNQNDYPAYPGTSHPEDNPGFGYQTPTGYQKYQGYQNPEAEYDGYGGYAGYSAPNEGQAMENGTGTIDVMRAVKWGFRAAYSNALVWILGFFGLIVAIVLLSVIGGIITNSGGRNIMETSVISLVLDLFIAFLSAIISIFILRGGIHQVDKPKMEFRYFKEDVNLWPTFGLQLLINLVIGIVVAIIVTALGMDLAARFSSFDPRVFEADPTNVSQAEIEAATSALGSIISVILGAALLFMLLAVLISPLYSFMPYFLVEKRESFGGAISAGFKAGTRNYLRLLLFYLVSGFVLGLATLFTIGLAMIFLIPPVYLAFAHMYRQAAAGPIPVEEAA